MTARSTSTLRRLAALVALGASGGIAACVSSNLREADESRRELPAGVLQIRWRTSIHDHGLFEPKPEECATGTLAGRTLITGSRAGRVVALHTDTGQVLWSTEVSGSIDGEARFDPAAGQAYVGTDDGSFYALDPGDGHVRWSFRARGAIDRPPEIGTDTVYVATAADRVFALESASGKLRWLYEREPPEGFTIHGNSGPRFKDGVLYAGFSDGYLVALEARGGEPLWARSLASAAEQYVDVDSTPTLVGDLLLASSFSGGLYGLGRKDGETRWRVNVEGAGTVRALGSLLYFAAPRDGLTALTLDGRVLWRQGLADAGDLTAPQVAGPYLIFSGSRAGLFVVDRRSGQLAQTFNPGRGMCGSAALDGQGRNLFVLANSGSVYALQLAW